MHTYRDRRTVALAVICISGLALQLFAGTVSPARTALEDKNYDEAIQLLKDAGDKDAEQWYLLGEAYAGKGLKKDAHGAWNECLQINKNLGKSERWTFLFPPNKPLKGTQKKALKDAFEAKFKSLNAIILRNESKTASAARNEATRTKVDASRADADAKRATSRANATSEAIKDKQRVADRRARTGQRPVRRSGMRISGGLAVVIILVIFGIIAAVVIFGRSSGAVVEDDFEPAPFGCRRYRVGHDDGIFGGGPFWYEGHYFHSEADYYRRYGHHYTNSMYLDNYDRYGRGQGRDMALDAQIMQDIEDRGELREEAAEATYEADNLRADAADLEADAEEADDRAEEYEDSADSFDDDSDLEDDEGGEEEFEDDEGAEEEEFEDDEEEEEEFEDDEGAEEEEFEDDPDA